MPRQQLALPAHWRRTRDLPASQVGGVFVRVLDSLRLLSYLSAMDGFNWICPFCNRPQTVTGNRFERTYHQFSLTDPTLPEHFGSVQFVISCANDACGRITISYNIVEYEFRSGVGYTPRFDLPAILVKKVIPESHAKPQPSYIPQALREDYEEACLIRDLSPKASATLIRRCLQGMIRDFCGIANGTLNGEIKALREQVGDGTAPQGVSPESVDAIDAVRNIGNIGAHMEKNIDHIVPVEPDEAQILIELVESLFDEWYVARQIRVERFSAIRMLAAEKKRTVDELKSPVPAQLPKAGM